MEITVETRPTKWTPMKALGRAQKEMDALGLPNLTVDLAERLDLEFSKLTNYDNKQLEDFLTLYGGYKGYLETKISDIEATVGALDAAFTEGFNTALFKVAKEYEEEGRKKPTREELRGEILYKFESLRELKRDLIEQQALLKKTSGLLNTYTTAYNTVSRIVALRTYGTQS
tara:strand:+ start:35 stop:550 length:516 start_codon:yes stop_codon:yes gene_type:complete